LHHFSTTVFHPIAESYTRTLIDVQGIAHTITREYEHAAGVGGTTRRSMLRHRLTHREKLPHPLLHHAGRRPQKEEKEHPSETP
jgi:hypothetical protein